MASDTTEGGADQDYFLAESEADGTQTSLKSQAQQMLGAMTDQGRELYELKFGADARQMLEQALDSRDFSQLVEVTRRYFHTLAGYEATMLIGRLLSRPGTTVGRRPAVRATGGEPGRGPAVRTGAVGIAGHQLAVGRNARPRRETLVALQTRDPQATLRIGDKEVSLFKDDSETTRLAAATRRLGRAFPRTTEATEWVLFRGNAARNAESAGGFPLLTARWRVRAANHPSDEEMIRQQRRGVPGPGSSGDSGPAAAGRGQGRDHADGPLAGGGRHGDRQTHLELPLV